MSYFGGVPINLLGQVVQASPALHGFRGYLAGGERRPHVASSGSMPLPQGEEGGREVELPHAPCRLGNVYLLDCAASEGV